MTKLLKIIAVIVVLIFALIGMVFTAVFFVMQQGILNVRGNIEDRNSYFGRVPKLSPDSASSTEVQNFGNGCREGFDQEQPCEWNETTQWDVVQGGLLKDAAVIKRVSDETGVSQRMIAAAVIPEQIRFFTDNREVFKRYFEPLKILASLSQFSLGVSGIKQNTAEEIEKYASDPASPFYPGEEYAKLIGYTTSAPMQHDQELFNRLTDEKDHYYSYLYTALYLKEIEMQWKKAGYDVSKRPDVLVTLFNIGFAASEPKEKPQVGGAPVTLGGQRYSFGDLGATFYHSDELLEEFPR